MADKEKQIYTIDRLMKETNKARQTIRNGIIKGWLGPVERIGKDEYYLEVMAVEKYKKGIFGKRYNKDKKLYRKLSEKADDKQKIWIYRYTPEEAKEAAKKTVDGILEKVRQRGASEEETEKIADEQYDRYFGIYYLSHREVKLKKPISKIGMRNFTELPNNLATLVLEKYDEGDREQFINLYLDYYDKGYDMLDPTRRLLIIDIIDDSIRISRLRDLLRGQRDIVNKSYEDILDKISRRRQENMGALGEILRKGQTSEESMKGGKQHQRGETDVRGDIDKIK